MPRVESLPIRQRRLVGKPIIEEQARSQVRSFLDELKNGTTNYRTVASLGDQVAQEYRGRAVMELLQNAHDVLGHGSSGDQRQVSFVLNSSSEQPELLIANSGRPFRREDFRGICQLAQSPKDPNKSVGNKGLGFRSVLELTTRPEVWSTAPADDDIAFTFGFDRDVLEPIAQVARRLFDRDVPTDWVFGPAPVVDWSDQQLKEYRRSLSRDGIEGVREVRKWVSEEVEKYLSPYVLPLYLGDPPPQVARLLDNGHVTVIRLPLDGGRAGTAEQAVRSVREQLVALDEAAMVFLPHLSVLRRKIDEEVVELKRQVVAERTLPGTRQKPDHGGTPDARHTRLRVGRAGPDATAGRSFNVWSRVLGGADQPEATERIAAAVRHLPNRWPEVRKVEVAVAVEATREARQGALVIFLPTTMKTGIGAHVNAPSYGSLDRKTIDFGDAYNDLMLEFVVDLALDAVRELVTGPAEPWRGRAVIDLLAQAGPPPSDDPELTRRLRERARDRDDYPPLEHQALILCDGGWRRPGVARTMPELPSGDPFGEEEWRREAGFDVASCALDERRGAVEALLRSLDGSSSPHNEEWVDTLALMARRVRRRQADAEADWSRSVEPAPDWNLFLSSVLAVLPPELRAEPKEPDNDPLAEAEFLPTEDGRLLSASDAVRMFFQPRHGADDAADFVGSVPVSLKERIAFLHRDVETHEGPERRRTEIQKFLDGRFVRSFRREDLLRGVVIPSLPELPAAHGSPEAAECADVLAWTQEVVGQEEPEGLLPLLSQLPVACIGGWFPMREAVFGSGWTGRHGNHLNALAEALGQEGEELLRNALLPPGDDRWFPRADRRGVDGRHPKGIDLASRADQFARSGVVDGLRLKACEPIGFWMSKAAPELPDTAHDSIPSSAWDDWKQAMLDRVKPEWKGEFEYELQDVKVLPILHRKHLDDSARAALSELILASLAHWKKGWEEVTIRRRWWSQQIPSPLKHWLSTLPWLHEGSGEAHTPLQEARPLSQRWLVPTSLLRDQFRHLAPLDKLAQRLAKDEALLCSLAKLGLNVYPTEEDDRIGPVLLDALAGVVQPLSPDGEKNGGKGLAGGVKAHDGMPAGGFDVLLGQVRLAWRHFDPNQELPRRFVVRTRPHKFEVRTAASIEDAYLPDDAAHTRSLREHHQPIFAMWPKEARGEIGKLLHEKGARRASELEEHCLVDGRPVADLVEASQGIEARLEWLPVVLLSLAAYGGNNPRGPATGAWLKAKERLQRARVLLCNSIEVELLDANGGSVAHSAPDAYWVPQDVTLLLNRDVAASGRYERIAPAAQAMLERHDLLKDLRLVLGSLAGHPQPTHHQVEEALGRAEIDGFDVAIIVAIIGGDIKALRDRIRPVLKHFGVSDDGFDDAKDASGLTEWLSRNSRIPEWPAEDLMAAARASSYDDFEMGFRVLGDDVELPRWNEALEALGGEYRSVENEHAADQTTRHLMLAARSLRAFAKHVANKAPGVDDPAKLFSDIRAVHEGFVMDPRWSRSWWTVPFRAVLGALRDRYENIPETREYLGAFASAHGAKDFDEALKRQGVDLEPDPDDDADSNERRVRHLVRRMWKVYQAWFAKQGGDRGHVEQVPAVDLDATRYLCEWSEDDAFKHAKRLIDNEGFLDATKGCMTIDAMREKLGISRDDCDRVGPPPRGPDPVIIAGTEFVVGRDSYSDLFERLDRLDLGPVPNGLPQPTDSPVVVDPPRVKPTPGRPRVSPTRERGPVMHPPAHLPELVGIVGEMHAYRYLKSTFHIDKHRWVAQFRTKVFPLGSGEQDKTDDRLGYDFEFPHPDGKIWCVEVKSTTRDGTSFDVTAGELAAARRLAGGKEKRWLFLRVRRAFSHQPEFDWLPNPFEPAGRFLQLREGSMTVEYALSEHSEDDHAAVRTSQSATEDQ